MEAVAAVYEHGAGHARREHETERDEQVRRFFDAHRALYDCRAGFEILVRNSG
jgi:hypothetical protein